MKTLRDGAFLISNGMSAQTLGPMYLRRDFSCADVILTIAKLFCNEEKRVLCR